MKLWPWIGDTKGLAEDIGIYLQRNYPDWVDWELEYADGDYQAAWNAPDGTEVVRLIGSGNGGWFDDYFSNSPDGEQANQGMQKVAYMFGAELASVEEIEPGTDVYVATFKIHPDAERREPATREEAMRIIDALQKRRHQRARDRMQGGIIVEELSEDEAADLLAARKPKIKNPRHWLWEPDPRVPGRQVLYAVSPNGNGYVAVIMKHGREWHARVHRSDVSVLFRPPAIFNLENEAKDWAEKKLHEVLRTQPHQVK